VNLKRGLTRLYIVLWIAWATAWVAQGVTYNLEYGQVYKSVTTTKKDYEALNGLSNLPSNGTIYWKYVPDGKPRIHFTTHGSFGQLIVCLLVGLVFPALPFAAIGWIARGFAGPAKL